MSESRSAKTRILEVLGDVRPPAMRCDGAEDSFCRAGDDSAYVDRLTGEPRPTGQCDSINEVFAVKNVVSRRLQRVEEFHGRSKAFVLARRQVGGVMPDNFCELWISCLLDCHATAPGSRVGMLLSCVSHMGAAYSQKGSA